MSDRCDLCPRGAGREMMYKVIYCKICKKVVDYLPWNLPYQPYYPCPECNTRQTEMNTLMLREDVIIVWNERDEI